MLGNECYVIYSIERIPHLYVTHQFQLLSQPNAKYLSQRYNLSAVKHTVQNLDNSYSTNLITLNGTEVVLTVVNTQLTRDKYK